MCSNFILTETPRGKGDIYATYFTYIRFKGECIYPATVIDLYTREIVGITILSTHATELIMNAFFTAAQYLPAPRIIHSDLKMSPLQFANRSSLAMLQSTEKVS